MPRALIDVKYLAYADPSAKANIAASFRDLLNQGQRLGYNVVAATTAGFTNTDREPEGLVAQGGTIVNPVLRPDQDALVVVQDGGVRVVNLKNDFALPKMPNAINPLLRLIDYAQLVEWISDNGATVFQTQLLAAKDTVLVKTTAPKQVRERRMLAATFDSGGQLSFVLVDITKQYTLLDQTTDVVAMLEELRIVHCVAAEPRRRQFQHPGGVRRIPRRPAAAARPRSDRESHEPPRLYQQTALTRAPTAQGRPQCVGWAKAAEASPPWHRACSAVPTRRTLTPPLGGATRPRGHGGPDAVLLIEAYRPPLPTLVDHAWIPH